MSKLAILGGQPAVTIQNPERWKPPIEEEKEIVCQLIEKRALSGAGSGLPKEFEEESASGANTKIGAECGY
jgi:hypothetical protein